jgi:hypothetical protein
MSQRTLYRGISSKEIQSILKNGIPAFKSKYEEARSVLGKYVNPKILTDEFLEENKEYIAWVRYRFRQFIEGVGTFCMQKEIFSNEELNEKLAQARDLMIKKGLSETERKKLEASLMHSLKAQEETPIRDAILYAKSATKDRPEYERYIVSDLKTLKESIVELEEEVETLIALGKSPVVRKDLEKRLACRKILLENLKPEYKDENGNVKIPKEKGHYPVILEIKGDLPLAFENEHEVRLQGDLKAEDITGVAFVPDNPKDQPLFLSKEEFLKQLQQKQETNSTEKPSTQKKEISNLESFLYEHSNQKISSSKKVKTTLITPQMLSRYQADK